MNRAKIIKMLFSLMLIVVGLSMSCMMVSAGNKRDLNSKSNQELTKMIEKNDAAYARKSEKQMELNKTYKEKIVSFRSGDDTELSKQTLKVINRTTDIVNKNVEKLSNIKNKINTSKQTLNSITNEEQLKAEKIKIIKNQRKANKLLTKINNDLEVLVALLE